MRVGVAGLGRMGTAMAERLIESGVKVAVWNRSGGRLIPMIQKGVTVCGSPAAMAGMCDVIITSMFDAEALHAVFEAEDGFLAAKLKGKIFIEMSTVRPETQEALSGLVAGQEGSFIECPVGGTVGPARAGKLLGLVGGDAEVLAQVRPVLDHLCRRIEHCGPVGAGATMKLAINLPLAVYWQALGEAYTLAKPLGRDATWFMDVMGDSSGAAKALAVRGEAVVDALEGGDGSFGGPASFDLMGLVKDMQTMLAEAASHGKTLPVTARTLGAYMEAVRQGMGERDAAWMPAFWANRPPATTLTLDVASVIADVTLAKGRAMKLAPLTVAVLDAGGHLVAFKRADGSGILRFDIAFGKAWGALGMGFGSRELAARAQTGPAFIGAISAASGGRVVPAPGGVLIRNHEGTLLGAVGVSGDVSDADETCALAGIAAVGLVPQTGA